MKGKENMATKKKTIKTYGVKGLMEWVCNIPVGRARMRVEFTGGVLTKYGVSPAKYTTNDLFKQTLIENSALYKAGRIRLLSAVETDEDEDRLAGNPGQAAAGGGVESPAPAADDGGKGLEAGRDGEGRLVVEVGSLDDAKAYLNGKFGIPARELRSGSRIVAAAGENGVYFKGLERYYGKADGGEASAE